MPWREYIECPDCGRSVCIDHEAGETRSSALKKHRASGQCRPRDSTPEGPLSLTILRRCFEVNLEFIESGVFDGDIVRYNLEELLCHKLPPELEELARRGLDLIGPYGFVSEKDSFELAAVIRQILEILDGPEKSPSWLAEIGLKIICVLVEVVFGGILISAPLIVFIVISLLTGDDCWREWGCAAMVVWWLVLLLVGAHGC